jgi:hypothetical protein
VSGRILTDDECAYLAGWTWRAKVIIRTGNLGIAATEDDGMFYDPFTATGAGDADARLAALGHGDTDGAGRGEWCRYALHNGRPCPLTSDGADGWCWIHRITVS